jgi:cell division transport system permease protein
LATPRKYRRYSNDIAVVISISLVLYVLGIFGLFFWNAWEESRLAQQNLKFEVFFNDSADDEDVKNVEDELKSKDYVRDLNYISKEQAALNFIPQWGSDFTQDLGYNPLNASVEVYLENDKVNEEGLQELVKSLESNKAVEDVKYSREVLEDMGPKLRTLSLIFLLMFLLLLIIALALINYSIRLSFYAQRFLIKSMQLVGATKGFILKPYIGNSILQGLLGALIAITLITATIFTLTKGIPVTRQVFVPEHLYIVYGVIILTGILITCLSSMIVMQKYLRRSAYELY